MIENRREKMNRLLATMIVLVILGSLLLGACATSSQPSTSPAAKAPATSAALSPQPLASTAAAPASGAATAPKKGGTLRIIQKTGPSQLGYVSKLSPSDLGPSMAAFEGLVFCDKNGMPEPWLATDWQIDPNGKYIIFHLRKGVKFHDGTPFNAEAAVYDITLGLKNKPGEMIGVTSVEAIDDYTIRLNTDHFSSILMPDLGAKTMMASPTFLKQAGEEGAKLNPVGTGPFKFVDFKRDVSLKYERFNDYWDQGKPYTDALQYQFILDPMTASAAFQAGDADIWDRPTPKDASELKAKGFNVLTGVGQIFGLFGDSKNSSSIYANKKVREAIEYAIDRDALVKTVGFGFLKVRKQFSPEGCAGYDPTMQIREYNPTKAKQLLADAGYPNGFKTTIICVTQYSDKDMMAMIKNYLAQIGIDATLDYADPGRWTEYRYTSGWKDSLLFGANGGWPSAPNILNFVLSEARHDFTSTARPAGCQALLDKISMESDPQKMDALIKQMVNLLNDDAMFLPLYSESTLSLQKTYVHDTGYYANNHMFLWHPGNAWLSK
jgi:peptide/nickel transport system substrate-binding protein